MLRLDLYNHANSFLGTSIECNGDVYYETR